MNLQTKAIAYGIVSVLVIVLFMWGYNKIYDRGYDARTVEYQKQVAEAKEESDKNLVKTEKAHEKNIQKIQDMQDNDSVAGPILSVTIDGLPEPE